MGIEWGEESTVGRTGPFNYSESREVSLLSLFTASYDGKLENLSRNLQLLIMRSTWPLTASTNAQDKILPRTVQFFRNSIRDKSDVV